MKYQNLFFGGKIRKNILKCHLLKFLPSMLSINKHLHCLLPLPPFGTLLGILACLGRKAADGTVADPVWKGDC